ncbi:MAG: MltA domain-containing protein [Nitrospinae bacterium]|nr:MltA domain-containing protein [Nitrospinota bacterium]
MWKSAFSSAALALALAGCVTPPPAVEERPAMERVERFTGGWEEVRDIFILPKAAQATIEYLGKLDPAKTVKYGGREVTVAEMKRSVERFIAIMRLTSDPEAQRRMILDEFDFYRAGGEGGVLVTGYYQPVLDARRQRDETYRWPLYAPPGDLVRVDLGAFSSELAGKRITGRVKEGWLVPYHSRQEIDEGGALAGRGLEVAWVSDPVEAFMLHVQGSGMARFEDGATAYLNFAGANGREYRSIGKLLIEEGSVTREAMSLDAIRQWAKENPGEVARVLNHNPSYVFFRLMDEGPFGATGVKLVPGRSVALDYRYFPPGALAFLSVETPAVNGPAVEFRKSGRFVFNHDQGAAIKGAGRVDLFFGMGPEAGAAAGVMKHSGELWLLLLKPSAGEG